MVVFCLSSPIFCSGRFLFSNIRVSDGILYPRRYCILGPLKSNCCYFVGNCPISHPSQALLSEPMIFLFCLGKICQFPGGLFFGAVLIRGHEIFPTPQNFNRFASSLVAPQKNVSKIEYDPSLKNSIAISKKIHVPSSLPSIFNFGRVNPCFLTPPPET